MADKRRRARVQGSWAAPMKKPGVPQAASRHSSENVAGERWLHKEQAIVERKFVFQDPTEVQRKIPEERIIDKEGVYDISNRQTGVSRLCLKPGFIEPKEADWMFEQLHMEIPWEQKTNSRRDGSYQEPRLTSWYGELPYTYSRSTMKPNPHWHPLLTMLKDRIEEVTGHTFNSLLCNLYRNDKDSIDWHSDDEPSLGTNPIIASLSFGETRNFELRKKPPPEEKGDYTYVDRIRIPLDHGCLLVMEGETQKDWQHRVPKEYHDRGVRINLTFRTIFPNPSES
ncbi:alpha-ketoglutarate-dependent dioxygenase alkB homolog 3 [Callorhinchus milii]|uniref:Alpha-ketoglutarate-dependent dioxygenase alkB homolog 3 n=1 Tax=Callorhinchus milii TaxID=7868 RepID=V9L4K7_CALMI|nr:alpha-ketoglutarate-dependent dioxygenase alkB homolog 3 [Callorhinchus milii]XP_042197469.1 alpha-ketoglutarate-dependent dioxygenase alkB homolog 3 [Callorhinchus milii]XP_042197470.1 alpha-ketoglutarate-dependent dioxygenase alkB homolog 3 [Callorhinchus milii]|eukprot:gi/632941396/ref/XP_007885843.1/ PREDICTED: alpha-ketoglutarate-dependent dioxygenase alkB homolog 3 [Callorhinchus milii]